MVGNYQQITKINVITFIYCVDFQFVALGNIAHYVTDEDYEAGKSQGIKPDIDDFTLIQHRKKSDHNRKTFSSHSRHNPLFLIKLIFVVGIPMRLGCFADSFFDIGHINQHF